MTNGEKIKEIFPYLKSDKTDLVKVLNIDNLKSWWNAEYKEPTTKNDLEVENDLVSSIVERISEKATETREEFIFETIRPYCENVVQMKISKRDLEQALLKYYGKNDLGVDCIKKSDAINIIQDMHGLARADVISDAVNRIITMPSVTLQEPRWIPVTEDAPPKGTICLWCNKQGSVFTSEITYRSEFHSYVGKHGYFCNGLENYGDIVAWMPLPKPYREVEE